MDITIIKNGVVINGVTLNRGAQANIPDAQANALINALSAVPATQPLPPLSTDPAIARKSDGTPSGLIDPATGQAVGGVADAGLMQIVNSYEQFKELNPRTRANIRSYDLVSDTIYADATALETAFPAAANANKGGKVGVAGNYKIFASNGAAWADAGTCVGYLRTGVNLTGYAAAVNFLPAEWTANVAPANNGVQLTKPMALYGAIPYGNNGLQGQSGWTAAGARMQTSTGRAIVSTDEAEPIIRCGGFSTIYYLYVDLHDGNGPQRVVDTTIAAGTYSNLAFLGAAGGGINPIKLDLSQLGSGRRKRSLILPVAWDITLTDIRIKPVSSYFKPPASPRVLFFTDSLGSTVYNGDARDGYVPLAQDFMGVHDTVLLGEGGTGFVNLGPGNAFRTHEMKLRNAALIPQYANPDLIVIQASANDNNLAGIKDAVTSCLNFALATWPTTLIVVTGPTARNSTLEQGYSVVTENAVKAGIDAVGSSRVLWVPMMTDNPQAIRGNGAINAPAGDGNADLMFNTGDAIHWPAAGHLIWCRDYALPKIMAAVRAYLAGLI